MAENSYLSMFADPSSDIFAAFNSNDEGAFMSGLQPNIISPSTMSSYQPLESESIMTLGEPNPLPKGISSGSSYTHLGLGRSPYASFHHGFAPQQPQHSAQRYPGSYYNPSSLPPGGLSYVQSPPGSQMHPQRFGHDPYRQAQFNTYSHHGTQGNVPQNSSSWSQQKPLSPLNPPGPSYMTQQGTPLRHHQSPQGYPVNDSHTQFLGHPQSQYGGSPQGFQGSRSMLPDFGGHLSSGVQQPYQGGMQYGYPNQQPGMPQTRLPGMPYGMQSQIPDRYGQPGASVGLQPQQTQSQPPLQPPTGMLRPGPRPGGHSEISNSSQMSHQKHPSAPDAQPSPRDQNFHPSAPSKPPPSPAPSNSSLQSLPTADVPRSASSGNNGVPPSPSAATQAVLSGQAAQGSPAQPPQNQNQHSHQTHRSPDSPSGLRPLLPPPPSSASPLPSMFGQPKIPQPGQYQSAGPNTGNMMGPPPNHMAASQQQGMTRLPGPQHFTTGQSMMPPVNNGVNSYNMNNGPLPPPSAYMNGPSMMQQSQAQRPSAPVPTSMPNIGAEIFGLQVHVQQLLKTPNRPPEVERKISEFQARIALLQRHQAAAAAQSIRMPYPPQGLPSAPRQPIGVHPGNVHHQGMVNAQTSQPPMGMASHTGIMRPMAPAMPSGLDGPRMPGAGPGHVPLSGPPVQNGFPSNGHPSKENSSSHSQAVHSPQPGTGDSFANEITSSQDTDEEAEKNKYATPKKRRRNAPGSKRKRTSVSPKSSETPSKSRGRPGPKGRGSKVPPKTTFQFGRKKKKRRGSDDEGDDLDATPPPSPPPIEQDFDGNYVEKRRSTRVTKRKKYVDEGDVEMSERDDALLASRMAQPMPMISAEDGDTMASTDASVPITESTVPDSADPAKSFFVQPGDADPIVIEKIMSSRTGKRTVKKAVKEESKPEPESGVEDDKMAEATSAPDNPDEKHVELEMIDVEEFYVKFKSYSYLHCDWKTAEELESIDKRIKQKITRYKQKKEQSYMDDEEEPFDPNFTEVDRILDERSFQDGDDATKNKNYFLCKWAGLPYDESTWEVEEDCDAKKMEDYRRRQVPPPPHERKTVRRPSARDWAKMNEPTAYKNGNTLRDYQLEGVNWLLFSWYHSQNCILADEMGLGKTVQSTVFLEHVRRYGIRGPFLVVVPLSTLGNWAREVEIWTDMNAIVYHGGSTAREVIKEYEFYFRNNRGQRLANLMKFNIFITTYEILLSDIYELREIEWRAIVIDEAHRLKNKNCKLLEGLKLLDLEHRVLLTGTPLQNNVEELFSLLNFLEPERFSNAEAFSQDFGDLKTDDQVQKLQQLLKPMMLRRLKEDVEKSIAPKEETIIEVELTNMQKKWYRAILEKNFTFLQKGTSSANVPNLMNTMMELRKCCNHPYLINGAEESIIEEYASQGNLDTQDPELLMKSLVHASGKLVLIDKLLPKLKDGGHKVLVFSQMVRCLDILEDYLVQKRYLFERIDGRIRGPDRQAAIDRFSREDSDRFVFLLCTRAGGLGINLTAADTVIIFDSDWNPQNDLQAQARCHRIGQNKPVKVYRLITRNSYEREMFDKASLKLGLDKAVLQSGQMAGAAATGREAYAQSQQQLSKSDIEDLLKRGAYGALMEDDAAADQFCTEDIDQILQRRTQTVQLEAGEKGSTFSKASFAATGTRDDIDINDPDFWQKWAKKAEVNPAKDAFENELIIHEPRRRLQVRRYGEEHEEEMIEDGSDEEYDSDDENGKGRRGRRGKKGAKGREKDEEVRPGSWHRMECLRLERGLLAWGWGRWKEILADVQFKRRFAESDVEIFARTLVHYCCKNYSGSDDKAKPYIWEVVLASYKCDWTARKAAQEEQLASAAAVAALPEESPSSNNKLRKLPRKSVKKAPTPPPETENGEMPDWDNDPRFDPTNMLDASFLKHMKKNSVNRLILRLRLLQNLKEEVILNLGDIIMADTPFQEIQLEIPPQDTQDKPTDWWDDDADKCLLVGVYKHGYEQYVNVRNDANLCFLSKCGPSEAVAPVEKRKDVLEDGEVEPEEVLETGSTDLEPQPEKPKRRVRESKLQKESPADLAEKNEGEAPEVKKTGRGRRPAAAKRQTASINGQPVFPSDPDLNTRVRRLIAAFEKRRVRAEQMEVKKQQRLERQVQIEREKEARRLEQQQKKWSKREEIDFYRIASTFGVEYGAEKDTFEWEKFRDLSKLDKKLDQTLTEYYRAFYAMLKKVCGKKLTLDEELIADQVEPISDDKATRCLQRIDLLYRIREISLRHPKLEERLKLCQPSLDLPHWWLLCQHDRELLEGAAKHGLLDTACNIAVDCDYTFADCIKTALNGGDSKKPLMGSSSKMESILKRDILKTEETDAQENLTKLSKKVKAERLDTSITRSGSQSQEEESEDRGDDTTTKEVAEKNDGRRSRKSSACKPEKSLENDEEEGLKDESIREEREDGDVPAALLDEKPRKSEEMSHSDEKPSRVRPKIISAHESRELNFSKASSSRIISSIDDTENPHELTVAQLLAKGMYAKGWPSDRVIQARLDHVCYCIEHNRWPSKRTQAAMLGCIPDEPGAQHALPPPQFSETFMENTDFAMLAAAGHIPGFNGLEPRRGRRGRRPKAEIEAERLAQYHAAHQALLQQQQAFMTAANTKTRRSMQDEGASINHRVSVSKPPPAHGKASRNNALNETEGVLDLTGKSRPTPSVSSASTPTPGSSSGRKEPLPGEKGSKLSQKVDILLKKRKQEAEHADAVDPECRIPVISMRDGSILQGDKAPKYKDLWEWLSTHPHYIVDQSAFTAPLSTVSATSPMNGSSFSKRSARGTQDSSSSAGPSHEGIHLSGDENVTVIHRETGKKICGRKAPQLKSLGDWLETNPDYNVDPSWMEILRQQGANAVSNPKPGPESSKRGRKSASDAAAAAAASASASASMFGSSPFGPGFSLGPGGLLPGFPPRMPFGFPGIPGFPLPAGLMGMLPGMGGEGESQPSSKPDGGSSSSKKGEGSSGKERESSSSSSRKSKAEKEKNQQQAMESMMQSQLPFIFPQAGLFGGLHPMFGQGFPGFPFAMGPNPLLNGFTGPNDLEVGAQEKLPKSEKASTSRKTASSPAESSSSRAPSTTAGDKVEKTEPPQATSRPRGRPPKDKDRGREKEKESPQKEKVRGEKKGKDSERSESVGGVSD